MQFSTGLIYDLIFLVILVLSAVLGARKGFLASLFSFVGTVLGVVGAVYATREFSLMFYVNYLGAAIGKKVEEVLAASGGDLAAAVAELDFLPGTIREQVNGMLLTATGDLPTMVINALEPVLMPLIQAVVFIIVCLVIRFVFRLIAKLLKGVNHLPLLGSLNKTLGFGMGAAVGLADCWLLSLGLWLASHLTNGSVGLLSQAILTQSTAYNLLQMLNPFVTYY